MGARIAAWGYVALFVDDFATRGLKETCAVDFKQALPDADGALAYLRRLSYVDPDKIAVVGFSQGGDTALKIAAGGAAGFKAAAAFYPPCANLDGAALGIPTLILVGAKDEVTPAADCAELAKRQAPSMVKFVVYPGAAHAFDLPEFAARDRRSWECRWPTTTTPLRDPGRSCAASSRLGLSARPSPRPGDRRPGLPRFRTICVRHRPKSLRRSIEGALMLRREFLLGAAAAVAASTPAAALAAEGAPLSTKAAFVAWMTANRPAEDPKYLERRWDRYQVLLSFNDLWTPADKRAFLMTPRQEFCLPEDKENAYVGHYLDIGFGVTITPPGTMGRMTSALDIRVKRQGARDRHRLRLSIRAAHLSHDSRPFDRDHSRARRAHAGRLRSPDRRGLSGIFRDHDPK